MIGVPASYKKLNLNDIMHVNKVRFPQFFMEQQAAFEPLDSEWLWWKCATHTLDATKCDPVKISEINEHSHVTLNKDNMDWICSHELYD